MSEAPQPKKRWTAGKCALVLAGVAVASLAGAFAMAILTQESNSVLEGLMTTMWFIGGFSALGAMAFAAFGLWRERKREAPGKAMSWFALGLSGAAFLIFVFVVAVMAWVAGQLGH